MDRTILEIGKKNGEMDFGVSAIIADFSLEELNDFRATLVVAIGIAEDMWRRANNEKAKVGAA